MKTKSIITILFIAITWNGFTQRVSQKVGTNPTIIAPSAVVEIESTTKGFLPPRMTFVQRNAINSPATGLIVYCTDCGVNGELQVYNGITWTNITGSSAAARICRVPTNNGGFLKFKCHNLGADENADPFTPSWKLFGAYFQWGRKPMDTNGNNYKTKLNNGPEGFVAGPSGPESNETNEGYVEDWNPNVVEYDAWNLNELSPLKTGNDPCPIGFRVPTKSEWLSIYEGIEGNWTNVGTNQVYSGGKLVSNSLFLPFNGIRLDGGDLLTPHWTGNYWSSTNDSTYFANSVSINYNIPSYLSFDIQYKIYGMGVRCVAE